MVEGNDGDLWLVTEGGALTRYHLGSFHTYGAQDGIPADSVRAITADDAGNVWILSGESIRQLGRAGELVDLSPTNLKIHYEPLYWECAGFWGIDRTRIVIFLRGRFLSYALPSWLPAQSIWAIGIDHDASLRIEDFKGKQAVISPGQQDAKPVNGSG